MTASQKTQLELTAAMEEFQLINHTTRSLWGSVTALKNHVDEKLAAFLVTMQNLNGNPLHLGNSLQFPFNEARHQHELANLKTLTDFLTSSPEYIQADALVRPAVEKIESLQSQLNHELGVEARANQERLNEIEARKAAAIEAIEAEFSQPAPPAEAKEEKPFRGRVARETAAV